MEKVNRPNRRRFPFKTSPIIHPCPCLSYIFPSQHHKINNNNNNKNNVLSYSQPFSVDSIQKRKGGKKQQQTFHFTSILEVHLRLYVYILDL